MKRINVNQAKSVLSEPVTVHNPTGADFRFTKDKLLAENGHLRKDHTPQDFDRRVRVILYGIGAARTSRDITNSRASQPNSLGVYPLRKEVRKQYTDRRTGEHFDIVVRADSNGEVYDMFYLFQK